MCQIERGGIKPGGQVGRLNLGGEDANVAAVDADTSDYNLFFIFIVEQDTFKGVILTNIHIMTEKYNCLQIQAIIQSFDKVVRHTCTVVFCKLMLWSSMEG